MTSSWIAYFKTGIYGLINRWVVCYKPIPWLLNFIILRIKHWPLSPIFHPFLSPTHFIPYPARHIPSFGGAGEAAPFCCAWALFSLPFLIYLSHFLQLSSPGVDDESAHSDILWDERMLANGHPLCVERLRGVSWKPSRYLFRSTCFSASRISSSLIPRSRISCRKWLACMSHATTSWMVNDHNLLAVKLIDSNEKWAHHRVIGCQQCSTGYFYDFASPFSVRAHVVKAPSTVCPCNWQSPVSCLVVHLFHKAYSLFWQQTVGCIVIFLKS